MALSKITNLSITDDTIVNADVNSSAAIAKTKLASLDVVNADVNASAAIALSKLATDPSNASNLASGTVPTARLEVAQHLLQHFWQEIKPIKQQVEEYLLQ